MIFDLCSKGLELQRKRSGILDDQPPPIKVSGFEGC